MLRQGQGLCSYGPQFEAELTSTLKELVRKVSGVGKRLRKPAWLTPTVLRMSSKNSGG